MSKDKGTFLKDMNKLFPNFCYYRLAENKKGGAHYEKKENISHYNSPKLKFGIYFTPNGEFALSDGVRRKENAKRVFCFFTEKDTKDKFWEDFPLPPSIVNKTKRGHHVYWMLKEPEQYSSKWDDIQNSICELLGTDKGAKDVSRILRVPGFVYRKDNEGTFVIENIIYEPENTYTFSDFRKVLNIQDVMQIQKQSIKKDLGNDAHSLVETIDRSVDVRDVLHDLGGSKREVRGLSVREEGRKTGGYKYYSNVNGLNNFTEHDDYRPKGGPFSVAQSLLGSSTKAFEYFRDKYNLGIEKKTVYRYEGENVTIDENSKRKNIATGTGEIIIDYKQNKIFSTNGKDEKEIMDAVIEPKGYYEVNGVKKYICQYFKKDESGTLVFEKLGKGLELESVLSERGLTFFGTKNQKQWLIGYIHDSSKEYLYIDSLGIYGKNLIVNKMGQDLVEDGKHSLFIDISGLSPSDRLKNEIFSVGDSKVTHKDITETIQKLNEMYEPHISVTAFVIFAMGFFSYHIRQEFGFFPIMFLVGLTQSGKTSLRRTMMKLFGLDKAMEVQASTTEFVIMKFVKHYIPLSVGEFKNTDMKVDRDDMIKNNYDGTSNSRGTASQSTIDYPANAPLVFDGESRTMNNAAFSRSVMFFMNPSYRKKNIKTFKNVLGYFIDNYDCINSLLMNFDEESEKLSNKYKSIDKSDKDRVIENYSLILAFAKSFNIYDETYDNIIKQCDYQFSMMNEDNVEKNVKTILGLAIYHSLNVSFQDAPKLGIKIEFDVDVLKIDESKVKEIQSQIQTTNHHFNIGYQGYDELLIPLDFIFNNKSIHSSFNRFMNRHTKLNSIEGVCVGKIKGYAESNGYTKQSFYHQIGIDVRTHGKFAEGKDGML